jgi:hypothetical protein
VSKIAETRQSYIETQLEWVGYISRRDIMKKFGLSESKTSKDIKIYIQRCQEKGARNTEFDPSAKIYRRRDTFQPIYKFPTRSLAFLNGSTPALVEIKIPRPEDHKTVAAVHRACTQPNKLHINYYSVTSDKVQNLNIWPHHIVDDGNRLHARAYAEELQLFKDFVIGRMEILKEFPVQQPPTAAESTQDKDWVETETITLVPHPSLKNPKMLETEHGMKNGQLSVTVPKCFGGYLRRRMGVIDAGIKHFIEQK